MKIWIITHPDYLYDYTSRDEFLDCYANVVYEVNNNHDDSTDVATTYLGKRNSCPADKPRAEESFPIMCNAHAIGQVVPQQKGASHIPCDVLFDIGASKSYMSKSFYLRNKSLHHLPKFMSSIKNIQVGNARFVSALFVIPIITCLNSHYFEIFTLVAEIQANIDLVFAMKNMYEVEGELSARHSEFRFLNICQYISCTRLFDTFK